MLYKHYPAAGGIVFRRYYGMGVGIPVPQEDLEAMAGEVNVGEWTVERTQANAAAIVNGQVCVCVRVGVRVKPNPNTH